MSTSQYPKVIVPSQSLSLQLTKIKSSASTIPQYHQQYSSRSLFQQLRSSHKLMVTIGVAVSVVAGASIWAWLIRRKNNRQMYYQERAKQWIKNNTIKRNKTQNTVQTQQKQLTHKQSPSYTLQQSIKSLNISYQPIQIPLNNKNNEKLHGYFLLANTKQRNPRRIIIYFQSQHTSIADNLEFIRKLIQSTVSNVLVVQYRYNNSSVNGNNNNKNNENGHRSEKSMKQDCIFIIKKALQIAKSRDQSIVILGKDLGAMLGIYICSLQSFRYQYKIKGLIIQNCTSNSYEHKAHPYYPQNTKQKFQLLPKSIQIFLNKMLTRDKWQSQQNMHRLRVPTLLLIQDIKFKRSSLLLYQKYQGMKKVYEADIDRKDQYGGYKVNQTNCFMEINVFMNNLV